jgi:hypothetical protein
MATAKASSSAGGLINSRGRYWINCLWNPTFPIHIECWSTVRSAWSHTSFIAPDSLEHISYLILPTVLSESGHEVSH